jgi:hypothetical protein
LFHARAMLLGYSTNTKCTTLSGIVSESRGADSLHGLSVLLLWRTGAEG